RLRGRGWDAGPRHDTHRKRQDERPRFRSLHHRSARSHPRPQDQQDRRASPLELVAARHSPGDRRLMGTITYVRTLDYVATMLEEDAELLEAIVSNDDNLSYGNIISVCTGPDAAIAALTDHGVEELADMIRDARRTTKSWHQFLDNVVVDPKLAARLKRQPR